MTFAPINSLVFQVQENITFTENKESFHEQLNDLYNKSARAINARDISLYTLEEILNGQKFITNTSAQNYVYRKYFNFGAIAPGAALLIPHGLTGTLTFTRIYGTFNSAVPDDRPLPYVDTFAVTNQVSVLRNGANMVIQNGATAPAIISGLLIIEYIKS